MEKYFPHKHIDKLIYASGDLHKYYCTICDRRKFTIETRRDLVWDKELEEYVWIEPTTRELTLEEAEPLDEKAMASIRATMWILDNVEPTVSAGRDDGIDYPYKTEDGKIVKK